MTTDQGHSFVETSLRVVFFRLLEDLLMVTFVPSRYNESNFGSLTSS